MSAADQDRLVADLQALSERELIEVLTKLFELHARRFDSTEDRGKRYVLAISHFEKGEDAEPYIHFCGVPSAMYWTENRDEALDHGTCPTCGVEVTCVNKLATCPVCGTTGVECT